MQEKTGVEHTILQETNHKVVMDVRDITKSLPLGHERIDILKGISFQIMSGEFVSIVGPEREQTRRDTQQQDRHGLPGFQSHPHLDGAGEC